MQTKFDRLEPLFRTFVRNKISLKVEMQLYEFAQALEMLEAELFNRARWERPVRLNTVEGVDFHDSKNFELL